MKSADYKEIQQWRPAVMAPCRSVLALALFAGVLSLSGCTGWFRGGDVPAQAASEPGKTVIVKADGDKNASPVDPDDSKPPSDNRGKTEKDAETRCTAPGVSANVQPPPVSAGTGGLPPEGLKSPAGAVISYNGETISEDTVWSGKVIVRGSVTIAPQATVTIGAGTVVAFGRSEAGGRAGVMLVRGRIAAAGTKDRPVRFLPEGNNAESATWQGIIFLASEKNNILDHCRIEGAETGVDADYSTITVRDSFFSGCHTALLVRDSRVRMSGCTASGCDLGAGLYESEAEIAGGNLVANRQGIFAKKSSLYLGDTVVAENSGEALRAEESNVKIAGNKFGGNGDGLVLSGCKGLVSGNRISQNRDSGISLTGSRVRVTANDISRNGRIGIRVADGKGIAWENIISANGQYDVYNAGPDDFRAIGNWWGTGRATDSPGTIYDRAANPGIGRVLRFPVLRVMPSVLP